MPRPRARPADLAEAIIVNGLALLTGRPSRLRSKSFPARLDVSDSQSLSSASESLCPKAARCRAKVKSRPSAPGAMSGEGLPRPMQNCDSMPVA